MRSQGEGPRVGRLCTGPFSCIFFLSLQSLFLALEVLMNSYSIHPEDRLSWSLNWLQRTQTCANFQVDLISLYLLP